MEREYMLIFIIVMLWVVIFIQLKTINRYQDRLIKALLRGDKYYREILELKNKDCI